MILIIDDDKAVQTSLSLLLRQRGYEVTSADGPESAMDRLRKDTPELILLDLNFSIETSGKEGLELLSQIRTKKPSVPVILITGWATIDLAVRGMKLGAKDFISKPWDNDHLLQSISTILALEKVQPPTLSRKKLDEKYDFDNLIGEDPSFLNILESVGRVAATDASVLILGESGTGKELIAEAIHQNSKRAQKPFVKVNLGGIPENLFESELFGHKRGAFTDARFDRKGRFELAHTGTIFLDEIGDLQWANQVKLLRVLQDHTFEVLGSSQTKKVNVRVISATNRDLSEMVSKGQFREDLFYRLNLITIRLPALRERPGDIPRLIQFYINNLKNYYDKPQIELSTSAMNWLKNYPFPGNIRQLKNVVERTVLLSNSTILEIEDFQPHLTDIPQPASKTSLPEVGSMTLEEMEVQMIKKAMAFHQNKVARVARALGLTRSSLYRRLDKYEIPYE